MGLWSNANIEIITKGHLPITSGHVLIQQHQQAGLFDRTTQHELNISGAHITLHRWLETFHTIGIASKVGSYVQKK